MQAARESNLKEGEKVRLQQPNSDKLSPSFKAAPYEVVNKHGGQVEIKSPAGVHYKLYVTHLQKYEADKLQETKVNGCGEISQGASEAGHGEDQQPSCHRYSLIMRPRRDRQPEHLKDYELH